MSVYTRVSKQDLEAFLKGFDLGQLLSFRGIEGGIENTNYFVTTTSAELVLTLFEALHESDLTPILNLAYHLGAQGLAVPVPIASHSGKLLHKLNNKPAILCPKLAGVHIQNPSPKHCFAIGQALAQFHSTAKNLKAQKPNAFGLSWWQSQGEKLVQTLSAEDQALLRTEVQFQAAQQYKMAALPRGWIHSDLFHDNALFSDAGVAIIDLYSACQGSFIYDLAVLANDWCCTEDGQWQSGCVEQLFAGYGQVRTLTDGELQAWPIALRAGALRWWLGRLQTKILQARYQGELALSKDPNEYRNKLLMRQVQYEALHR
jgi:homoserine kinase type II